MSDLFTPGQVSYYNTAATYAKTRTSDTTTASDNTVTDTDSSTGSSFADAIQDVVTKKSSDVNKNFLQSTKEKDNLSLTMEDFLMLMVKQFENQDIENPADTSDMLNQLMQMSTIQSMTTMTDASMMTYAASLVGKEVTIGNLNGTKLEEIVGVVTGTGTYDGEQVVFVGDKKYPLTSIMAVGKIPENLEADDSTDTNTNTDTNTDTDTGTTGTESTT